MYRKTSDFRHRVTKRVEKREDNLGLLGSHRCGRSLNTGYTEYTGLKLESVY